MSETAVNSSSPRQHFQRQYKQVMWATVIGPLVLSWAFGFFIGEAWPYFFGVTLLSLAPPLFGIHDLFFEFAEWVDRRRKAEVERQRRATILAEDAEAFRATVAGLGHDELWHLARSIVDRRPGFTLERSNPALATLIDAGLVEPARHFRADGYPYYIPDRPWIVMHELADEILRLRDRKGPRANSLADDHVPEELILLYPERYRTREPWTMKRVGRVALHVAERGALGVASLAYQLAFVQVFWGLVFAGIGAVVILLVSAGWAIGALYGWLFG